MQVKVPFNSIGTITIDRYKSQFGISISNDALKKFDNNALEILKAYESEDESQIVRDSGLTTFQECLDILSDERKNTEKSSVAQRIINAINFIRGPIALSVPSANVTKETVVSLGQFVVNQGEPFSAFVDDKIQELISNPLYKPLKTIEERENVNRNRLRNQQSSNTISLPAECSVWVWSKALSTSANSNDFDDGSLFNLTPFVKAVQTRVADGGGNFQILLPPITAKCTPENIEIDEVAINRFRKTFGKNKEFVFRDSVHNSQKTRKKFFFHEIIAPNDIIFIKFEQLQIEPNLREGDNNLDFIPTPQNLPGQVFDMIGLVDANTIQYNAEGAIVNIQIVGRDLIKTLIDDGTYVFPLEQGFYGTDGEGEFNIFSLQSSELKDKPIQRIFGRLDVLNAYVDRDIEFTLKFLVNLLSNIGICNDTLFKSYGDRVTTKFNIDDLNKDQENEVKNIYKTRENSWKELSIYQFTEEEIKDVSQLEVGTLPESLEDRLTTPKFSRFIDISAKRNNITGPEEIREFANTFNQRLEEINQPLPPNLRPEVREKPASGIWQIIKLVIEPEAGQRRLVDVSLATDLGPLINFVNKVCVKPFVEFYTDTYGDQFYFIVRRPPITRDSYISNPTISVSPNVVVQDQFQFDLDEVYSWYRLIPNGNYFGAGQQLSYIDFPAVFLPEYAQIYGSKPLDVTHNYIDYLGLSQIEEGKREIDFLREQGNQDLRFLIEGHAYKPFVRKGTITLAGGDRRIKKGMNIYYEETRELFLVKSVNQTYQIGIDGSLKRFTQLEVVNGMKIDYYDLYFKIIDFNIIEKEFVKEPEPIKEEFLIYFWNDRADLMFRTSPGNDRKNITTIGDDINLVEISESEANRIVEFIQSQPPEAKIEIIGNTDSDPTSTYVNGNQTLSELRAKAIKDYVLSQVSSTQRASLEKRITTSGNGASKPKIAPDDPYRGWEAAGRPAFGDEGYNDIFDLANPERRAELTEEDVERLENLVLAYKAQNRRTDVLVDNSDVPPKITVQKLPSYTVNKDLFDFFQKRRQFCNINTNVDWEARKGISGASSFVNQNLSSEFDINFIGIFGQ